MHVITVLRDYLGMTQQELARQANITQADLSEIESLEPYGKVMKYERLAKVLGLSVDALVRNDYTGVPASFFETHEHAEYLEETTRVGREGEEEVFRREQERLQARFSTLDRMVIPYYKMRSSSPGYDILSFDDEGKPIYIEVKTTRQGEEQNFRLTAHEHEVAQKLTARGERYYVYRITNWGQPEQKLHIIPFQDMVKGARIIPCQYVCTMKDRVTEICGIAYHRRSKGITQEDLAGQLGILPQHLCRYETGGHKCPVTVYQKISDLLEVPIDDLLATYPVSDLKN
ncbi:MAG: protein NO VEIN domain-containing protein [Oscillospiraceae bacterium]